MSQIIISQIELFNFKSFKGKHVIKGLEPHFNTIIGPNGSGKSNIIDSILFVLGFKAKKMRHKLNSDLIYQGDTKEKECFVEITFVKGNKILKVKRKLVHNKSFYYINDKEVQQKELVVFMENEGVDIENNRFLILQGEIESISLMKPKNNGMLEYIEDAIGTSKYILQIEELEKEKKIKEDIFENKATEFKFNEKEFQFIKEKKESNEKLLKEYVDKISKISELCNLEESKNKIEQLELEENLKNVNEEINKINEKNKDIKKKMALNEERLHSKKKKIIKKENTLNEAKQKFYDVDKINALNENKKERIKKNIKDLKNNLEIKRDKNAVYEKEKIIFEKEIAINKNLKSEYEKKIAQFKKEIKGIKPKNEEAKINQELKNHESDLIRLAKKKDDLNEQIYNLKKDIEKKNDLEEMLKENLNEIEERIKKLTEEKITLEKEIYDLEHKIFSLKRDLSEKENNLSIFENEEENQNRQSKAISILKKVDGFIGRLGNLGTTKKEFDVAVSTAGKGNLNNFVVNNTETAEKCIEILKKNSLERSSFIVMDKIKDFTLNGNFDYLIDKIECEEKYRKLFYFAFGETILCSNLEEGKKIAFGNVRRKVVTLDGKMIEKSGLMSGGGFFKGSMKTEKFAFKKCKEEIEGIKKEINLLNEEKDKRSKTLLKIKHELSEKEDYMEKKSKIMPKEMILKELKKLNKIIEDEDFDKLENEKLNIEKLINENQENINKKQEKLDELEDMTIRHKRGELSILFDQLEGVNNKILDNKKKNSITLNYLILKKLKIK
ncbi:Structural maintenance of chromosomes protein 4 [Gurleya vavrai]